MVELKSTANSANSREKKSVQSVRSVGRQCPLVRGEKFTSWYTHHAKSQRPIFMRKFDDETDVIVINVTDLLWKEMVKY